MNLHLFSPFRLAFLCVALLCAQALQAVNHNPALNFTSAVSLDTQEVIKLSDPAANSPLVPVYIQWPPNNPANNEAPDTGTLTLRIEDGSDKVDLFDANDQQLSLSSPNNEISWTSNYPTSFKIKAKAVSTALNDVKLKISFSVGNHQRTAALTVVRLVRALANASGAGSYQSISTANANMDVLPGQKMYLKFEAPAALSVTSYEWILPGVTFKDYDPTRAQNQLTNLATSDKNSSTVVFYWADTGDNREVKCRVVTSGSTVDITEKMNVKKPTSMLSASGENPRLNDAKTDLGMFAKNTVFGSTLGGIVFDAGVTDPEGFSGGAWCYAQIVDATIDGVDSVGPFHLHAQGLDKNFPYYVSSDIYTSGSDESTSDSPQVGLGDKTSVTLDESFTMYVMYKPSGYNSKHVPLRKLSWRMRAGATKTGGNWVLTGTNSLTPSPLTDAETFTHPQWTSVAQDAQYTR